MYDQEIRYLQALEQDERLAAARATHQSARDAHTMMAQRYADRAGSIQEGYAQVVSGYAALRSIPPAAADLPLPIRMLGSKDADCQVNRLGLVNRAAGLDAPVRRGTRRKR
jgi:hypothetical protein